MTSQTLSRRTFVGIAGLVAGTLASPCAFAFATDGEGAATTFTAGTYQTTAYGMGGAFDVSLTCTDSTIEDIQIGENAETAMVGTAALEILKDRVLQNQSLALDTVSGATYSSTGLLIALEDLVKQANGDLDALTSVPVAVDTYTDAPTTADVLIVGGGLAGATAAIAARQGGANVILLEALDFTAGNSSLSSGNLLLGGTSVQASAGIEDDADTFYNWIMEKSEYEKDPDQSRLIADNCQAMIDWWAGIGIEMNPAVTTTEGSDILRNHNFADGIGGALQKMAEAMDDLGVDIRYSTKGVGLVVNEDGAVTGVVAVDRAGNEVVYNAPSVVLASGGFAANHDMIVEYWGDDYATLVYGGLKGMDGAMLQAAMNIGAQTVDMTVPHVDATLEVTRAITVTTRMLSDCGGILIRQGTGQRFVDEARDHCEQAATAMHDLGDEYYYEIYDNNASTVSSSTSYKFKAYNDMGLTSVFDSVEAMAEGLGVDPNALQETIDNYNAAVRGEQPDEFGRETFYQELAAPFYTQKVSNGVACTIGGVKVNTHMQALDENDKPIEGLYVIGEMSGGYLVRYRGGDSLVHSSIQGMLVGQELGQA